MDTNYFSALTYSRETMQECIECGEIMLGVYSYEIREICKECGGGCKQA